MLLPDSVFISYRRADDAGTVGRLVDRFKREFGNSSVFFDVSTIEPGEPFPERIKRALVTTELMLVMIGPRWLERRLDDGSCRLHDPEDYVRIEIEAAIQNGAHIIPVLLGNATLPFKSEMPDPIVSLIERQAFRIENQTFDANATALTDYIRQLGRKRVSTFHEIVATLYKSLGYKLTNSSIPHPNSSSFIAERFVPGLGYSKFLIICAPSRADTYTQGELVRLLTESGRESQSSHFSNTIVVSEGKFNPNVYAYVGGYPNLTVITLDELKESLLDVRQSLLASVLEYEKEELYNLYIDLDIDVSGQTAGGKAVCDTNAHHSIKCSEFIRQVIQGQKRGIHFFIGDFGAGKTTFLERIRYELSKANLEGKTGLKPIFFKLHNFVKNDTIEDFLAAAARDNFQIDLPPSLLLTAIRRGEFVLLFDGFDEVSARLSEIKPSDVMVQLCGLVGPETVAVLTSRPTYFIDIAELNNFISAFNLNARPGGDDRTIFHPRMSSKDDRKALEQLRRLLGAKYSGSKIIAPLTHDRSSVNRLLALSAVSIDEYLKASDSEFKSRVGVTWTEVKSYIINAYDLKDLVQRPILLSMVRYTVLNGYIDVKARTKQVGLTSLYEAFTGANFDREHWKDRQLLTVDGRQRLCELMALEMLRSGTLSIRTNKFKEIIISLMEVPGRVDSSAQATAILDDIAADGRLSALVTLSNEGYTFTHKSFFEYFVARQIVRSFVERDAILTYSLLPPGILTFLCDYTKSDSNILRYLADKLRAPKLPEEASSTLLRNAFAVVVSRPDAQISIKDLSLDAEQMLIEAYSFDGWTFKNTNLINSACTKIIFSDCSFNNLLCTGTRLEETRIERTEGRLKLVRSEVSGLTLSSVKLNFEIDWAGSSIVDTKANDSEILFNGLIRLTRAAFVRSRIKFSSEEKAASREGKRLLTTIQEGTFQNCELEADQFGAWQMVSFEDCVFHSVKMKNLVITEAAASNIKSNSVKNLEGFAFIHKSKSSILVSDSEVERDFMNEYKSHVEQVGSQFLLIDHKWWMTLPRNEAKKILLQCIQNSYKAGEALFEPQLISSIRTFFSASDLANMG